MPEETTTAASSSSEAMEEKPGSSSAAESSVDVAEEAKKLIGAGNRHLVMGDVVSAVRVFQDACAMLAEKFGDTADECGEAFFLCGKSLLELARMENTVLGNALEGVPVESSEEDDKQNDSKIDSADNLDDKIRNELREQVYEAMSEKTDSQKGEPKMDKNQVEDVKKEQMKEGKDIAAETGEPEAPVINEQKPEEPNEDGEMTDASVKNNEAGDPTTESAECIKDETQQKDVVDAKEEAEQDDTEQNMKEQQEVPMEEDATDDDDEEAGAADSNAENKGSEEEEEEEVGNLQLAWEMLEVAKVIYSRKENEDDQLMAAQIFLKLGEVGAESGNYDQAAEDFHDCLGIQMRYLPPHSRLLAETLYQLGTTLGYKGQYKQAIQHFSSSIRVIERRLAMLQEAIDKTEGADGATEEKRELEELKQLLPEIAEKVEDAKESQRTGSAASELIQDTLGGPSTSSGFSTENCYPSLDTLMSLKPADGSSSSSVSDISHLVRKKRKPEDGSPKKDNDAKKVKQDTTINGSADTALNRNGVQEKVEQEAEKSCTSENMV